jgi:hypothetical protein
MGSHFEADGTKMPGESGRFEDLVRDLSQPVIGVDSPSDLDILVWHGLCLDPGDPEDEWVLLEILWQTAADAEEEFIKTDRQ